MSKSLVSELLEYKTAREVWTYLCARFSSKNVARIMDIKTKLDLIKKGNLGLQDYFTRVKSLVDSLEAAGKKIEYDDHITHILRGLGPEYDPMVSVITGNEKLPPVQRVYSMLLTQENRSANLSVHAQNRTSSYSYGANDGNRRGRSFSGNSSRFNQKNWSGNQKPQCQLCGRFGHTVSRCYFRYDKGFHGPNAGTNSGNSYSDRGGHRSSHDASMP